MNPEGATADAASIPPEGLPRREFTPRPPPSFRVRIAGDVHERLWLHGRETLDREVCGVFLGRVFRDEAGPFLEVEDCVRGEHARSEGAQVTFTHETWNHIHEEIRRRHPSNPPDIVGWYHTHPGFGIFLSEMDLFIHSNFFSGPGQVAFVLDPKSGQEGTFGWVKGKVERLPDHWVGSRRCPAGIAAEATAAAGAAPERPRDADELDLARSVGKIRTSTLLALGWGLLLGWLVAQLTFTWQVRGLVASATEAEVQGLVRAGILSTTQEKDLMDMSGRLRDLEKRLPEDPPAADDAPPGPRALAGALAAEADRAARNAADRQRLLSKALDSSRPFVRPGDVAAQVDLQGRQIRRIESVLRLLLLADEWEALQGDVRRGAVSEKQGADLRDSLRAVVAGVVAGDPELARTARRLLPGLLPEDAPPEGPR